MAKKKTTSKVSTSEQSTSESEVLLVASKVKASIQAHGANVGSDALQGLNGWVHWLIEQASKRAEANGRKTVRAHDFMVM